MPTNISDSVIVLKPRKDWPDPTLAKDALVARFEKLAGQQLGNSFEFSQPIELRFNELISGVRTDLAVMIFGDDFSQLQKVADQVALKLRAVDGAADVRVEQISGLPTLNVAIDHVAAAQYGLSAADVSDALSTGIGGTTAGKIFEGDRRFNVVVRLDDASRNDPDQLASLPIATPSGLVIPLSSVARITVSEGRTRSAATTAAAAWWCRPTCAVAIWAASSARRRPRWRRGAAAGRLPTWGGQFENLQRAEKRLAAVVPVVFLLIGSLLFMALRSGKEAILVFSCVPLALVGGILALLLRGMPFSVSAAVGFIAVSGVATLNGLVLMQAIRERLDAATCRCRRRSTVPRAASARC